MVTLNLKLSKEQSDWATPQQTEAFDKQLVYFPYMLNQQVIIWQMQGEN